MMYDWGWGWGGGGMLFGPFFMLAGPILLIVLAVLVVRWLTNAGENASVRSPREILDERFARGDIDRNEYDERRRALGS